LEVIVTNGNNLVRYSSIIEELTDEHMYLAMPMDKGVPVLLLPGTVVRGRLIVNSTVWEFTGKYIDKVAMPLPMWIIEKPTELRKVQLRNHVRLKTMLTIKIKLIDDEGNEDGPLEVTTKDISGGGVCIITRQELLPNTKLTIAIDLPDFGYIETGGVVLRGAKLPDLDVYWNAVKFSDIKERDRELIIKYIFKRLTQQRRLD